MAVSQDPDSDRSGGRLGHGRSSQHEHSLCDRSDRSRPYMFVVGLGFDLSLLRGKARSAGAVSLLGIAAPFLVAWALMPTPLGRGDLFARETSYGVAWLFLGASISITAFPMLARMLYERGLAGTRLGTLTLAGSFDDAVAWCLLAIVLAVFKSRASAVRLTIGAGLAYGVGHAHRGAQAPDTLGASCRSQTRDLDGRLLRGARATHVVCLPN